MEYADLKIELICRGVRIDNYYKKEIIENDAYVDKRASLGSGRFFILNNRCVVNVPVREQFVKNSPYYLTKVGNDWILLRNGKNISNLQPILWPSWYAKFTSDGVPMRRIIQHHGLHNLAGALRGDCDYWKSGLQCKFCAIGVSRNVLQKTPSQILEVVEVALNENPHYDLHLGGGTTLSPNKGAIANAEAIKMIKSQIDIPICVEMVPPDDNSYVDSMINAGLDSLMFNLEIYNEQMRKKYCPGKSLISKARYFEALEYAVKSLGEGQVGSQLIAGLEKLHSTIEGAKRLLEIGVKPLIVVFRPLNNTPLQNNQPCDPFVIHRLYSELIDIMKDFKKGKAGCMACEGCYVLSHSEQNSEYGVFF